MFFTSKTGSLLIPSDFSVWLLSHCSIYVYWLASRESFARRWLLQFKLQNHSQQYRIWMNMECRTNKSSSQTKQGALKWAHDCIVQLILERPNDPYLLRICFLNVYTYYVDIPVCLCWKTCTIYFYHKIYSIYCHLIFATKAVLVFTSLWHSSFELWGEWKNIDERSINSTTSQALGFWSWRMGSASVAAWEDARWDWDECLQFQIDYSLYH